MQKWLLLFLSFSSYTKVIIFVHFTFLQSKSFNYFSCLAFSLLKLVFLFISYFFHTEVVILNLFLLFHAEVAVFVHVTFFLVEVVILVHFIFLSCRSFCSHSHFSFPFILPRSHELLLLFILPTSHAVILVHFISLSCRGCSFHSFDIVPVWKLLLSFTLTCSHAEVVALVHFTFSPCRSCYFHPSHFPFMQKLLLLVILRFSHAEVVLLSQFKFLSGRRFLVRFIVL